MEINRDTSLVMIEYMSEEYAPEYVRKYAFPFGGYRFMISYMGINSGYHSCGFELELEGVSKDELLDSNYEIIKPHLKEEVKEWERVLTLWETVYSDVGGWEGPEYEFETYCLGVIDFERLSELVIEEGE